MKTISSVISSLSWWYLLVRVCPATTCPNFKRRLFALKKTKIKNLGILKEEEDDEEVKSDNSNFWIQCVLAIIL